MAPRKLLSLFLCKKNKTSVNINKSSYLTLGINCTGCNTLVACVYNKGDPQRQVQLRQNSKVFNGNSPVLVRPQNFSQRVSYKGVMVPRNKHISPAVLLEKTS
jgi:hypothetical protein